MSKITNPMAALPYLPIPHSPHLPLFPIFPLYPLAAGGKKDGERAKEFNHKELDRNPFLSDKCGDTSAGSGLMLYSLSMIL
jgi:hypothetical protein